MSAPTPKCFICKQSDDDDLEYGEWKTLGDISVHYFCLVSDFGTFCRNIIIIENLIVFSFSLSAYSKMVMEMKVFLGSYCPIFMPANNSHAPIDAFSAKKAMRPFGVMKNDASNFITCRVE